jgi:hypothetical protein
LEFHCIVKDIIIIMKQIADDIILACEGNNSKPVLSAAAKRPSFLAPFGNRRRLLEVPPSRAQQSRAQETKVLQEMRVQESRREQVQLRLHQRQGDLAIHPARHHVAPQERTWQQQEWDSLRAAGCR